jgi:hypothetical protein
MDEAQNKHNCGHNNNIKAMRAVRVCERSSVCCGRKNRHRALYARSGANLHITHALAVMVLVGERAAARSKPKGRLKNIRAAYFTRHQRNHYRRRLQMTYKHTAPCNTLRLAPFNPCQIA